LSRSYRVLVDFFPTATTTATDRRTFIVIISNIGYVIGIVGVIANLVIHQFIVVRHQVLQG
jgi:hypothetical protein